MKWVGGSRKTLYRGHAATLGTLCAIILFLCCAERGRAQNSGLERAFPQSKATIEKALKEIQSATAGRLPVLDGFATPTDHPLDRYQRGYYQSKFQVSASPSGGSIVRVTVEVTAWYSEPATGRSGYQLLTSNGRLEADMLDQLAEHLASTPAPTPRLPFPSENQPAAARPAPEQTVAEQPAAKPAMKSPEPPAEPALAAPVPQLPQAGGGFSPSLAQGIAEKQTSGKKPLAEDSGLRAEANSLEQLLKNQAHPKNLVAVKKSGTPVVESASLNAKTLFLASAHDEFEMLDYNRDWVHVRISGLSRGWIWRNNLEMPDSVPDTDASPSPAPNAEELFRVSREETAQFPGDWAPLRGKNVRIVSVENINESKASGPQIRLEFVKSLFEKDYAELAQKEQPLAGIVVIFDSIDGGMIATTLPTLQQWKAGTLSDAALWHQCFFDPPETFSASTVSPSQ
jgi:hypothetical protein